MPIVLLNKIGVRKVIFRTNPFSGPMFTRGPPMKKMIFTLARYLTCAFTDMIHYRFKKCEFPGIPLSGIQVTRGFLIKQKHFYPSTIPKVYLYYFDILLEYCNGVRQNF